MAGAQQPPNNANGNIHKLKKFGSSLGGPLNVAFVGVDSAMSMKEGDNAAVAVGKALLTNAAFSLIPGGIVGAGILGAAMAAPQIKDQMDQAAGNLNKKKQSFASTFQETESQLTMMQQGIGRMQDARMHATRQMANHARGAQKIY